MGYFMSFYYLISVTINLFANINMKDKILLFKRPLNGQMGVYMEFLVQKAKAKNPEAFVQLMESQMKNMYKVAWSYLKNDDDAADAIQDTILTCFEKIDTLEKNKYFKTWLTRILINKCKAMLNNRKEISMEENILENQSWQSDYSDLEWNELLSLLDEKYRVVVLLYYAEGFKAKEISQILDVKESTVQSRLARAREKISKEYYPELRRDQA